MKLNDNYEPNIGDLVQYTGIDLAIHECRGRPERNLCAGGIHGST